MFKRAWIFIFVLATLGGCGGGKSPTDQLLTYAAGQKWTYNISGTATIGSSTTSIPLDSTKSTITFQVESQTAKDSNNQTVNILDRTFDIYLVDGREIQAISRLYYTQNSQGIFVHGFNNTIGSQINTANDKFVPSTVQPQYEFLYMPNPAILSSTLTYTNPFGSIAPGGYSLTLLSARQLVTTPSGTYFAMPFAVTEGFSNLGIGQGYYMPGVGIVSGNLTLNLSNGDTITGPMQLTSFTN